MPERHRLLRGMSSWIGFRQFGLKYDRAPRFAGTTKYPLRKMLNLALDGIFSSPQTLRSVTVLGALTAAAAAAGMAYSLVIRLFTPNWVAGWTTLILAILLASGVEMFFFGVRVHWPHLYRDQAASAVVGEMLEGGVRSEETRKPPMALHTIGRSELHPHWVTSMSYPLMCRTWRIKEGVVPGGSAGRSIDRSRSEILLSRSDHSSAHQKKLAVLIVAVACGKSRDSSPAAGSSCRPLRIPARVWSSTNSSVHCQTFPTTSVTPNGLAPWG